MAKKVIFPALFLLLMITSGCSSTTSSEYELDRRSGLTPSIAIQKQAMNNLSNVHMLSDEDKKSYMPVRSEPIVEKIWVYDQKLGPNWLQGTWYFIEIEPSHWLNEVDPGSNTLIN
jgi:hypothetical protein